MKTLILTTAAAVALGLAATAGSAASAPATLTIRHQAVGCHSWSLNGGAYRVEQTVRLREGQSLRVVNGDGHVHRLVKLSGGSLGYRHGAGAPAAQPHIRVDAAAARPRRARGSAAGRRRHGLERRERDRDLPRGRHLRPDHGRRSRVRRRRRRLERGGQHVDRPRARLPLPASPAPVARRPERRPHGLLSRWTETPQIADVRIL